MNQSNGCYTDITKFNEKTLQVCFNRMAKAMTKVYKKYYNMFWFWLAWTSITFVGDSVHSIKDPENENLTITEEIPRLLVKSWYPWNAMSGFPFYFSVVFQVFVTFFNMIHFIFSIFRFTMYSFH